MFKGSLPRIDAIAVTGPSVLAIRWKGEKRPPSSVDLAGWIATGAPQLRVLADPKRFADARLIEYGSAVTWDADDDGDLGIDAPHLALIAEEQAPFDAKAVKAWQAAVHFSNREAADFLGIGLSTWNAYRAGDLDVPQAIAMACRAARRDSVLVAAHFRPRPSAGRPRKVAAPESAAVASTRPVGPGRATSAGHARIVSKPKESP